MIRTWNMPVILPALRSAALVHGGRPMAVDRFALTRAEPMGASRPDSHAWGAAVIIPVSLPVSRASAVNGAG